MKKTILLLTGILAFSPFAAHADDPGFSYEINPGSFEFTCDSPFEYTWNDYDPMLYAFSDSDHRLVTVNGTCPGAFYPAQFGSSETSYSIMYVPQGFGECQDWDACVAEPDTIIVNQEPLYVQCTITDPTTGDGSPAYEFQTSSSSNAACYTYVPPDPEG